MVSSSLGAFTRTPWKRRSRLRSRSMCIRYSAGVVAPMHWMPSRESAGFRMFAASSEPSAEPAPTRVWSSSTKMMQSEASRSSFRIAFNRSSNWPRYFVPATTSEMSSERMRRSERKIGQSPPAIRLASPSTIAVFPVPGSPMSTGLFLVRRQSTWITRSSSGPRPISGSSLPSEAAWVRSTENSASSGVSRAFFAGRRSARESSASRTTGARTPWRARILAAAVPSASTRPRRRCSVPMASLRIRSASSRAVCSTFFDSAESGISAEVETESRSSTWLRTSRRTWSGEMWRRLKMEAVSPSGSRSTPSSRCSASMASPPSCEASWRAKKMTLLALSV